MKLSEITGEKAIDVLADILEPASEIVSDNEVTAHYQAGDMLKAIRAALKNHTKAVVEILAYTEGESPETYKPNVLSLPAKLLEILTDPAIVDLFQLQSQESRTSSGSAMVNTEAKSQ